MSLGSRSDLHASIEKVTSALYQHARLCDEKAPVSDIVQAGEELVATVIEYEKALFEMTGWSTPIRHLGRLPMYSLSGTQGAEVPALPAGEPIEVLERYVLIVDAGAVEVLAEGRGASAMNNATEAVRFLIESDGWDIHQYPTNAVRLLEHHLDVGPAGGDEQK